jgi:hypothetical protein
MKLKELHFADVAEIQEAITDELKKVQKEETSAAFQKLYDRAKCSINGNGIYFQLKKKGTCFPQVTFNLRRNQPPNTVRPHCVCI